MGIINNPTLTDRIMRRVYVAWGLRRATRNAAKLAILFVLAFVARGDIFYAQVFRNLHGVDASVSGVTRYAVSAFSGTEMLVKLALLFGVMVGIAMIWDLGKTVRRLFTIAGEKKAVISKW